MREWFSFLLWLNFTAMTAIGLVAGSSGNKIVDYGLQIVVPWVAVLLLALYVMARPEAQEFRLPRAALWVSVYLAWAGLSIFWSDAPNYAFSAAMWSVWAVWCFIVVLTMTANKVSVMMAALWGMVAGGVVSGVYYVAGSGLMPDAQGLRAKDAGVNVGSVVSYWNALGASSGIATIAALFLLTRTRGWQKKLLALLVPLLIGCTVATISKTAITATIVACLAFLFVDRGQQWLKKAGLVVVVLAGIIVALPYAMPSLQHYGESSDVSTLTGRTELWAQLWGLIGDAPVIGHGFMWIAFHPLAAWAGETHNDILAQLLHFGLIGLAIAALLYWGLARRILSSKGQFRAVAIAMLVFCLVRGLTEGSDTLILPLHLALLLIYASSAGALKVNHALRRNSSS